MPPKKLKNTSQTAKSKNMAPQIQAKPAKAGRVTVASLGTHPMFGGRLTSNTTSLPSAFVNIIGNSTFYNEDSAVMMPNLGLAPVRIVGCQPFQDIATAAASSNLLTNSTLATQYGANSIQVCPDNLNGPLAAKANLYDKYIFRDLLFEFVSLVATSQAGGMAMAFSEDGLQTSGALSFSTTRQVVPSISFPFRADRAYLHYHCAAPRLYFNLFNNTTAADSRQTVQGTFDAWPSVTSIGAVSQGFVNVYYVCELYDPIPSSGFTLTVGSKLERDCIKRFTEALSLLPEKDQDEMVSELDDRFTKLTARMRSRLPTPK